MAKQLSILKFCKTEISENEPRQMAASLINSIIDTVIQLAVNKQKRHTGWYRSICVLIERGYEQVELKSENEYIPISEYILSFKDNSSL